MSESAGSSSGSTPSSSSPPSRDHSSSSSRPSSPHTHTPPQQPTASATLHPHLSSSGHAHRSGVSDDPYSNMMAMYEQRNKPSAQPEKCFTFCSQRADARPLCRMFCLRKRLPIRTQAEDLARLRPGLSGTPRREELATPTYPMTAPIFPAFSPQMAETAPPPETITAKKTGTAKKDESWFGGLSSWSPFEALRRRLDPYSFIYVRGTPDGVVGRYMEEMEYDDGDNDFGTISRGATAGAQKRRLENKLEWLEWGDHGALLYLPLTSLFHPIISIPDTLSQIFSPSFRMLNRYVESFSDGSQMKTYKQLRDDIKEGGAVNVLEDLEKYMKKMSERLNEAKQEREKERERERKIDKMSKVGKDLEGKE